MKFIFCSMMFNDVEVDIKKSIEPNAISGHKFQENILRGLLLNGEDVYVLNTPRIRHYPFYPDKRIEESVYLFEGEVIGKSIGFCNRYLVNYISQFINLYKELKRIVQDSNEEFILLTFNSYLVQSINMIRIRNRFSNVKICDIIGDLHGKYGLLRKNATLKERLVDIYGQIEDHYAKKFDYFVFLSRHMKEAIPCKGSQYTVIEGIYYKNNEYVSKEESNNDLKILLYAGSLDVEYDIEHLIKSFSLTTDSSFRLYIAGNGNGKDLVSTAQIQDRRIKYIGVLSPNDLLDYQMKATALISPRKNNHRYVKYSFPSKTMECLALGKPYIAHRLDSEPEEYAKYIQYAGETDEETAQKIEEVLLMSEEQRNRIGADSSDFITREKNPKMMCKKLIELCAKDE